MGYTDVRDRGKYFQFAHIDGDNKTANSILKSTIHWEDYTRGKSGSVISLVMNDMDCDLPTALNMIIRWCNLSIEHYDINYPFHHFYKNIICDTNWEENLPSYSESILPPANNYSLRFLNDGISLKVQEEFGVRFSHEDNAILIPIYDYDNNLVGVKARNNQDDDYDHRWYAWLGYQKSHIVYGWYRNYKTITQKNIAVILESEKSVMQCASFGFNCALAIGGHSISDIQAKYISCLKLSNTIIAFDEGICEEECRYETKKLLNKNRFIKNNVGYIFDRDNKYLKKGSKASPSDLGEEAFKGLLKECVVYL